MAHVERNYWIVSPNVKNHSASVGEWRQASLRVRAAFMGWDPDDPKHSQIGQKFAGRTNNGVQPGDVILIARRHRGGAEVVGFGVVQGEALLALRDLAAPDQFGSLRRLQPFVPWSHPPEGVALIRALQHTRSLVQLHPERNEVHASVCEWMDRNLERLSTLDRTRVDEGERETAPLASERAAALSWAISVVKTNHNSQFDFMVRTKSRVRRAQKREAQLLERYKQWLADQGRELESVKYASLQCDGYEKKQRNLIEAKSSASREHVRMAVGQLLDYAFQGRPELGEMHKAILLPKKPSPDIEAWLTSHEIFLIWPSRGMFLDNANGRFT